MDSRTIAISHILTFFTLISRRHCYFKNTFDIFWHFEPRRGGGRQAALTDPIQAQSVKNVKSVCEIAVFPWNNIKSAENVCKVVVFREPTSSTHCHFIYIVTFLTVVSRKHCYFTNTLDIFDILSLDGVCGGRLAAPPSPRLKLSNMSNVFLK